MIASVILKSATATRKVAVVRRRIDIQLFRDPGHRNTGIGEQRAGNLEAYLIQGTRTSTKSSRVLLPPLNRLACAHESSRVRTPPTHRKYCGRIDFFGQ